MQKKIIYPMVVLYLLPIVKIVIKQQKNKKQNNQKKKEKNHILSMIEPLALSYIVCGFFSCKGYGLTDLLNHILYKNLKLIQVKLEILRIQHLEKVKVKYILSK